MAKESRFIIKRKDSDVPVDDVVLESEGLTIGRLISNDLSLNHPAISRTHAGIKKIGGKFWLYNLSRSNGTLLGGTLVDKTPLADEDVIQIGPYLLGINYDQKALLITIEREFELRPIEGTTSKLVSPRGQEDGGETELIRVPRVPRRQARPASTTRRQGSSGVLKGILPARDEQAIEIFWKDRRREAGKIGGKSQLHPTVRQILGKAQFNWRPTLDLKVLRQKYYIAWAGIIVAVLSIASLLAHQGAYSPGPLSSAHGGLEETGRGIARQLEAISCSNCHGITAGMQDKCFSCHLTQTFQPTIYDKHEREGIACTTCHSEHQGPDIRAGLVSYGLCSTCHNNVYRVKTGERTGNVLGEPHGGMVGYPVVNGKWAWPGLPAERWRKKNLPETWAKYMPKEQFHLIHQQGRMRNRMRCTDCHTAGVRSDEGLHQSPAKACAECHGLLKTEMEVRPVKANCNTCHQQHGQSEDVAKLVPADGKSVGNIKDYLASLRRVDDSGATGAAPVDTFLLEGTGGAEAIRHNKLSLGWKAFSDFGALPWYVWAALIGVLPIAALVVMAAGTIGRRYFLNRASGEEQRIGEIGKGAVGFPGPEGPETQGPAYPYPLIDSDLCISCNACVEACPHDVLEMVNGIPVPLRRDQCMEDTSCEAVCPTNPKACKVQNTAKEIPRRKVPARDRRLKTNVDGIYMIGEVSGVPSIKIAINEGGRVIDYIAEDLRKEGPNPEARYDVAIIGMGPGGLSAAVTAKQKRLNYIGIEQGKIAATIQEAYPEGKDVHFKPDTVKAKGGIPLPGLEAIKEDMLEAWRNTLIQNGVRIGVEIHEDESCRDIKREGGVFVVTSEKDTYKARKVVLAIGSRGAAAELNAPGASIKIRAVATYCPKCEKARRESLLFCESCGSELTIREDSKVKYKLTDPYEFLGKRCLVVGGGNSAIEAAVALTGFKRELDRITFTSNNKVFLVIRKDFKGDVRLANKMNLYDCIDADKIEVYFRAEIQQIKENEVLLKIARSGEKNTRIPNDYIFAMIGGQNPAEFLHGLGIKIEER